MQERQREKFAADELAVVLSRYDLGPVESITEFDRGSRSRPKVGIVCERGKFLLKRRNRTPRTAQRIDYSHRLQHHLAEAGFPLPKLIPAVTDNDLVQQRDAYVYELFEYVRGQGYDGSDEETASAGRTLARFHRAVADFSDEEPPLRGDYHDANPVRTALNAIPGSMSSHESVVGMEYELGELVKEVLDAYEYHCEEVEALDMRSWPTTVIHSDWHPGNMLFRHQAVVAVIDYDSVRRSQGIVDVANGTLQFSIRTAKQIEDWPAEMDEHRGRLFLKGYTSLARLTNDERVCLPHLMAEALIAESVLPIAATGSFGRHQGFRFMKMVHRKVNWFKDNADRVASLGADD